MNFGPLDRWRPSRVISFAGASDAAKNSVLI